MIKHLVSLFKSTRFKIFVCVWIIYLLGIGWGVHQMDEWAHYILIIALVEDKSFIVNDYVSYAYFASAYFNGNYYVAKAPGLSFLGVPIYIALKYLSNYIVFFKEYQFFLISFVTFLAALTTVLIYDVCRLLECNERTAIVTSLLYAFGTIVWTNSKMFEDGSVSPFFIILGIYLIISTTRAKNMPRTKEYSYIFLAGVSLGYSLLIEYSNILIVLPSMIYLFHYQRISWRLRGSFYIFLLPILICGSIILWLNYLIFGSPFESAYNYHIVEATTQFSITYIPIGIFKLFLYSDVGGGSLFFYQPLVFFTSTYGILRMYRRFKGETLLFLSSILLNILFFSSRVNLGRAFHHIGPWYVPPILPLLVIPTAFTIEYFSSQNVSRSEKRIFWSLFIGLFSFSILVIGICVLAYSIEILPQPVAYIKGYELLKSGYLDPRLLKHRLIPFIASSIIVVIAFESYFKKLYNFLVNFASKIL